MSNPVKLSACLDEDPKRKRSTSRVVTMARDAAIRCGHGTSESASVGQAGRRWRGGQPDNQGGDGQLDDAIPVGDGAGVGRPWCGQ
jgi:hypothetical protein